MATKDEKQWLSDVADLGCVVCRNLGYGPSLQKYTISAQDRAQHSAPPISKPSRYAHRITAPAATV